MVIFDRKDWTSGLNPQHGTTGLIDGPALANASNFYPFRPLGIAAPGYSFTDATNVSVVTGKIVGGVNNASTKTKGNLVGGDQIHELTFGTNTLTNGGGTFPRTINHAHNNETASDIVTYSVGSTRYAFYSFYDDSDWDVGRYDFATTFDDDYMSTVAASPLASPYLAGGAGYPHPMFVAPDDVLYIGDRNFVHSFDGQSGANGTFAAATYTLPAGYVVTSFAKRFDFLVVFAYRADQTDSDGSITGTATAFFYDLTSGVSTASKIVDMDDNYVSAGFVWRGTCGCFTSGRPTEVWAGTSTSKKTDLRIFNGSEFESVASVDGSTPIHNGVDVVSDEIMFASDGKVFLFAEKEKGRGYRLNQIASGAGSSSGFLRTMSTTKQYHSSGTTTSGGFQYSSPTAYAATASLSTILVMPSFGYKQVNRLKCVEVRLHTLGQSGHTLTLNVNYLGQKTTSGQQTIISSGFFTTYNNWYEKDYQGAALGSFNRIGIEMAWSASNATPPLVDTVILHYDSISNPTSQ